MNALKKALSYLIATIVICHILLANQIVFSSFDARTSNESGVSNEKDTLVDLNTTAPGHLPSGSTKGVYTSDAYVEKICKVGEDFEIRLPGAALFVGAGSLFKETTISITALDTEALPPMDKGMVNVTPGGKGFRFLPHGTIFNKEVEVRLAFDKKRLPVGFSEEDIRTFFYDERQGRWINLKKASVDYENGEILSLTDHFTDMINGVIQVPESPETQGFIPNTMKDIKAGDPSAQVNLIQPPVANTMGTAGVSYPFKLPPGRQGMEPQLALQYNSGGGHSWTGLGWNLNLPAVTIETRWGVPRYDKVKETETYLLNGQMLWPVAHRDTLADREQGEDKRFYPRIEGSFDKIIRHGDQPSDYWWEVTDKMGVRYFYGKTSNNDVDTSSTLKDGQGNIAYWPLVETRDLNGNFVRYKYSIVKDPEVSDGDSTKGTQIYIEEITYTGHGNEEGKYKVKFTRDRELDEVIRDDVDINCRLGFVKVTADRLRKVDIYFEDRKVRSYELDYTAGAFYKSLLNSVAELDTMGQLFNKHTFEYYDDVRDGNGNYQPFFPEETWNPQGDGIEGELINPVFTGQVSALGGTKSSTKGFGIAVTGGPDDEMYRSKSSTAGASFNYTESTSEGLLALIDINGDNLPDKVFIDTEGNLVYRTNLSGPDGDSVFSTDTLHIDAPGISNFFKQESKTKAGGAESHFGFFGGFSISKTKTKTTTYFSDVNNDGLIDIVHNGTVYFNYLDSSGAVHFYPSSDNTPSPIDESGAVNPIVMQFDSSAFKKDITENPLHDVVRVWRAPFNGSVHIIDTVQLVQNTSSERMNYSTADGIKASIQVRDSVFWDIEISDDEDYTPKTISNQDPFDVKRGDSIYFRLQSRFDGAYDQVEWNPTIRYLECDSYNCSSIQKDADGLFIFAFNPENDFLLSQSKVLAVPMDGKVNVEWSFFKPSLTDTIRLSIIEEDQNGGTTEIFGEDYLGPDSIDTSRLDSFSVSAGKVYHFRINSNTNVDWSAIKWNPVLYYTSSTDNNFPDTIDILEDTLFRFYPIVDYSIFANTIQASQPVPPINPSPFQVTPDLEINGMLSGDIIFSVKKSNELIKEIRITVDNGNVVLPTLSVPNSSGSEFYYDFYVEDPLLAESISLAQVLTNSSGPEKAGLHTKFKEEDLIFGNWYRNWGQFIYNGNLDYDTSAIDQSALHLDEALTDPPSINLSSDTSATQMQNNYSSHGGYDLDSSRFVMMIPSSELNAWIGYDNLTYVSQLEISSSRMGQDDLLFGTSANSGQAINKISESISTTFAVGGGTDFVSQSQNTGFGKSVLKVDFIDMGGDGYPDVITNSHFQYTDHKGRLLDEAVSFDALTLSGNSNFQESKTFIGGVTLGGTYNHPVSSQSEGKIKNSRKTAQDAGPSKSSNGINADFGAGTDEGQIMFMDITGDGLPDRIRSGDVSLNLGYRFTEFEEWGDALEVRDGSSISFGGGLGVNFAANSVSAGIGASKSINKVETTLQDVNGDGLIDLVYRYGDNDINVAINTGNSFKINNPNGAPSYIPWTGAEELSKGSSSSESANAAYTQGFKLGLAKICVNPQGNIGQSVSRELVQLTDINGDGYPDYLQSDADNVLTVSSSTIERTNKLKKVHRPLGAHFSLDYKREGNTYEMPNSVWTLSEVTIFDGVPGDGLDTIRTRFEYADGFYDRHEREFYGFKTVKMHELDTEAIPDTLYRSTVQTYLNDNYYEQGLPASELIQDAGGKRFIETQNDYTLFDVENGDSLVYNAIIKNDAGKAFPALTETREYFYEGLPDPQKSSRMTYAYDKVGNIETYRDYGEPGDEDDFMTTISYHHLDNNDLYLVGIPRKVTVMGGDNNQVYRRRKTSIDPETGNIRTIKKFVNNNDKATYSMTYDDYGNVKTIVRPHNHKNERMKYTYTYDDVVHTYVTKVEDSFNYESESEYDLRFGIELNSTDINGQEIRREIDEVGRITKITGPYELAVDTVDYTILFEYHTDPGPVSGAIIPWALTRHYDPQHHGNDLETVTFIDGLGRVLQVKKDGAIFTNPDEPNEEVMIVSGRVTFDAFGRTVESYYPVAEPTGQQSVFNPAFDAIDPTTTAYDILDRPVKITLPDTSMTLYDYGFDQDVFGMEMFRTKITDANGKVKDQFTNIRGLSTSLKEYIGSIYLGTGYKYNPVNELISAHDHEDNRIESSYDWLGRRITRDHPDEGLTEYEYDLASNLIKKKTANLMAAGPGLAIEYEYDFERLENILYPIDTSNNVYLEYGVFDDTTDIAYNRMGRVKFQVDATGSQVFFYDRLGEVNKNARTITAIEGRPPRTFTMRYKYDTWNRMTRMVYPDGEVLDYKYDLGGNLLSMTSKKLGVDYEYLRQMGYDKFEQRVYCGYGNNTHTTYAYEPDRRRLAHLVTRAGNTRRIMDNKYTYDKTNNVKKIKNNARIPILDIGGPSEQRFVYDDLYRLTQAKGYWGNYTQIQKFELEVTYNNLHDIDNKYQIHQRGLGQYINPNIVNPDDTISWEQTFENAFLNTSNHTSYNLDYDYDDNEKPHTATHIGGDTYEYDPNGNLIKRMNDVQIGQIRRMEWDEENRLKVLNDDERVHLYKYDADDTRVVKRKDIGTYIYVNGQLVVADAFDGDYTVYVNPYMVVTDQGYTKHYFIENQRITSKIGLGGPYGLGGNWGDWANWTEWEPWDNWANNDDWDNWYTNGNWEAEDGVWNDWYNIEEFYQYFFHPDHLGSTGYVTDADGEVHEHIEYLPYGEIFVQEHYNFDRTPYLFTGKELDEETGLYYFGARYYDPRISRWNSVDPMADKYPGWSPYNYTMNNPVVYVDPDGKEGDNPRVKAQIETSAIGVNIKGSGGLTPPIENKDGSVGYGPTVSGTLKANLFHKKAEVNMNMAKAEKIPTGIKGVTGRVEVLTGKAKAEFKLFDSSAKADLDGFELSFKPKAEISLHGAITKKSLDTDHTIRISEYLPGLRIKSSIDLNLGAAGIGAKFDPTSGKIGAKASAILGLGLAIDFDILMPKKN